MIVSQKMAQLSSSIFIQLAQCRDRARANGVDIIDLGVGTPDLPPAQHILDALCDAGRDPINSRYAIQDLPELTDAAISWYARRYGVALEPGQVCALSGSQDGLAHLPLALLNPGDTVLVPNPGYPIFSGGPLIASAELYEMPLREETGYLVDFDAIPEDVARRAKLMILSYPMNPLGVQAPPDFFARAVAFAKRWDIFIAHDNAYSELTYDGNTCGSFLSTPGALDVGLEFNSLSKSHNMTGMRISFALGNRQAIDTLRSFKSNIDYGVFLPVQHAAIAALNGPQDCVIQLREAYQARRNALVRGLSALGWIITPPQATMFVWAKLPPKHADSMRFCMQLIEQTGVVMVPGISFGSLGEGYVRIALVRQPDDILEACRRIGAFL